MGALAFLAEGARFGARALRNWVEGARLGGRAPSFFAEGERPPRKRCGLAPRAQPCLRRAVVSRRGCSGADGGAAVLRRGRRESGGRCALDGIWQRCGGDQRALGEKRERRQGGQRALGEISQRRGRAPHPSKRFRSGDGTPTPALQTLRSSTTFLLVPCAFPQHTPTTRPPDANSERTSVR